MKTAFLFSGQGAQYPGMGKELYEAKAVVRETFDEASDILGYSMTDLCFSDDPKLNETQYTQPAILTVSIAFWRVLKEEGYTCAATAGLSLGEYSALVASGALAFSDAVALVAKRGRYMTEAAPKGTGKMVAVMNAATDLIEDCCKQASVKGIVSPANYNTPQQTVIGGEVAAVDYAVDLLTKAGVKRMIPLNVSGPFHTDLLAPASEKLDQALGEIEFKEPAIPVISNTTAQPMKKDDIHKLLTLQVKSPVRFSESILTLKDLGITQIVEIGPGKVLSGFIRKIDKTLNTSRVEDLATLKETQALLTGGKDGLNQ